MPNEMMQAIKLTGPCKVEDLHPVEVPMPIVKTGYALIKVKAFGVNESEVTSRKGESDPEFSFPRILGIEGVGEIARVSDDSKMHVGQKVATMMEGLGRAVDGSYAEYILVAEKNLIPFETNLDWDVVGALPETLQTANGSLTTGLQLEKGDVLLIHGGTSVVGLMSAELARSMGATVISTSRSAGKIEALKTYGADYPILDDASYVDHVKEIAPNGVDKVLEFVGANMIAQDIALLKKGGKFCFTGALNGSWSISDFSPFIIPSGTYLTAYAGGVHDLLTSELNDILLKIEHNEIKVPIAKVYHGLAEVGQAQGNLESGRFIGKHVVVL